jgi:uncharacterized membrane protein (UPF0127 family)
VTPATCTLPDRARRLHDRGRLWRTRAISTLATRALATLLAALLTGLIPISAQAQQPLPTVKLNFGIHLVTAELADNDASRMRGLMFRERLASNHGMLFVFDARAVHCMWMRNTLIPLSVAFVDDDGSILNIEDMQPKTEISHCAAKPVRYALEMDKGWFAQRGLKAGAKMTGLPATR